MKKIVANILLVVLLLSIGILSVMEMLDSDNKLSGYVAQFDVAGDTCYFIAWKEYSSKNNTSIIINGDECDLIQGSAFEYDKDFSNIEIKGDEYKLESFEIPEYWLPYLEEK